MSSNTLCTYQSGARGEIIVYGTHSLVVERFIIEIQLYKLYRYVDEDFAASNLI
jgi:hypothetical protein